MKKGRTGVSNLNALKNKAVELRYDGMKVEDIGKAIGRSKTTVYRWVAEDDEFNERWAKASNVALNIMSDLATNTLLENLKDRIVNLPEEVKTIQNEDGDTVQTIRTSKSVYIPGNLRTATFLLQRLSPETYDRLSVQHATNNNERLELEKLKLKQDSDIESKIDNILEKYNNDNLQSSEKTDN